MIYEVFSKLSFVGFSRQKSTKLLVFPHPSPSLLPPIDRECIQGDECAPTSLRRLCIWRNLLAPPLAFPSTSPTHLEASACACATFPTSAQTSPSADLSPASRPLIGCESGSDARAARSFCEGSLPLPVAVSAAAHAEERWFFPALHPASRSCRTSSKPVKPNMTHILQRDLVMDVVFELLLLKRVVARQKESPSPSDFDSSISPAAQLRPK